MTKVFDASVLLLIMNFVITDAWKTDVNLLTRPRLDRNEAIFEFPPWCTAVVGRTPPAAPPNVDAAWEYGGSSSRFFSWWIRWWFCGCCRRWIALSNLSVTFKRGGPNGSMRPSILQTVSWPTLHEVSVPELLNYVIRLDWLREESVCQRKKSCRNCSTSKLLKRNGKSVNLR